MNELGRSSPEEKVLRPSNQTRCRFQRGGNNKHNRLTGSRQGRRMGKSLCGTFTKCNPYQCLSCVDLAIYHELSKIEFSCSSNDTLQHLHLRSHLHPRFVRVRQIKACCLSIYLFTSTVHFFTIPLRTSFPCPSPTSLDPFRFHFCSACSHPRNVDISRAIPQPKRLRKMTQMQLFDVKHAPLSRNMRRISPDVALIPTPRHFEHRRVLENPPFNIE